MLGDTIQLQHYSYKDISHERNTSPCLYSICIMYIVYIFIANIKYKILEICNLFFNHLAGKTKCLQYELVW